MFIQDCIMPSIADKDEEIWVYCVLNNEVEKWDFLQRKQTHVAFSISPPAGVHHINPYLSCDIKPKAGVVAADSVFLFLTAPQLSRGATAKLRHGQSNSSAAVMLHTWWLQSAYPQPCRGKKELQHWTASEEISGIQWCCYVDVPRPTPPPAMPCVARGYTSQSLWWGIRCQGVFKAAEWLLGGQTNPSPYISQLQMEQWV